MSSAIEITGSTRERALPHSEMLKMTVLYCARCGGREPGAELHRQAYEDEVMYRWGVMVMTALTMLGRLKIPRWLLGSYDEDLELVQARAWELCPQHGPECLIVLRDAICDYLRRVYVDHPHVERRLSEFLDKTKDLTWARHIYSTAIHRATVRMGRKYKCHCPGGNRLEPNEVSAFPAAHMQESNVSLAGAPRYEDSDSSLESNDPDAKFLCTACRRDGTNFTYMGGDHWLCHDCYQS